MKEKNLKMLFSLFWTCLKIGAFTFGGGYAMIPIIQEEVVNKRKWLNNKDILDIIAVSESTPGPIAINSATFIGYQKAGVWGSFFCTLGASLPSFCIILIISFFFRSFQEIEAVRYAFNGIRAGVVALIIKALISMYKQCPKGTLSYIIMAVAFILSVFFDINVLLIIICSALVGIACALISYKKGEEK